MDEFLPPGLSFFILTNTTANNFPFVSKNFEFNMGLDSERMKTIGVQYWLSHFHPEDLPVWVGMLQDLMLYTINEIPEEKRLNLSYTWNYRVRKFNGDYVNIFEHQMPLILDDSSKPIVGLAHLSIVGDGEPMPIRASIKYLNKDNGYETIVTKNYSQKALSDGLSNRERDIIRYLSLRKTSKEIAGILHISSHTVDTHRRNILKKLNIDSTGELVTYFKDQMLF